MADDIEIPEELIQALKRYTPAEARRIVASIALRGIVLGMEPTPDNAMYLMGNLEGALGKDASIIDNARYMAGWSDGCVLFRKSQAALN